MIIAGHSHAHGKRGQACENLDICYRGVICSSPARLLFAVCRAGEQIGVDLADVIDQPILQEVVDFDRQTAVAAGFRIADWSSLNLPMNFVWAALLAVRDRTAVIVHDLFFVGEMLTT